MSQNKTLSKQNVQYYCDTTITIVTRKKNELYVIAIIKSYSNGNDIDCSQTFKNHQLKSLQNKLFAVILNIRLELEWSFLISHSRMNLCIKISSIYFHSSALFRFITFYFCYSGFQLKMIKYIFCIMKSCA